MALQVVPGLADVLDVPGDGMPVLAEASKETADGHDVPTFGKTGGGKDLDHGVGDGHEGRVSLFSVVVVGVHEPSPGQEHLVVPCVKRCSILGQVDDVVQLFDLHASSLSKLRG